MVIRWEDYAVVEEKISHEDGGNDDIIKAPPVPAVPSFNKYNSAHNWVENTGPQYWQGMSVLQYNRLVKNPNTTLIKEIKLTLSRSMNSRDVIKCCLNIKIGSFAKFCN